MPPLVHRALLDSAAPDAPDAPDGPVAGDTVQVAPHSAVLLCAEWPG
jgi:hypothetical protein